MPSLSSFFARKGTDLTGETTTSPLSTAEATAQDRSSSDRWTEIGLRVGGDNEALRNLIIDLGRRIEALDDLRAVFGKLADPIDQTLRTLEQETLDNVSLRGAIDELRKNQETLREEFRHAGKKLAEKETEAERLRHALRLSQQAIASLEARKTELVNELEPMRIKFADLESQLARETAAARVLGDQKQALTEQLAAADKRIGELEAAVGAAREKLVLREDENRSLQASLDQMVNENSRLSRRVAENASALDKMRLQVEQAKSSLNVVEAERNKLAATIDEANERRLTETNTLSMRLESMSSRAIAAEKLLAEARKSLQARSEENSAAERKVVEATIARNSIDKKLELLQNALQGKERQVQKLEQSRTKLVERTNSLLKAVKAQEIDSERANEKIAALTDRVTQLEAEAEANQSKVEQNLEALKSQLQHEHLERTVAEGALRKARVSYAELQRDMDDYVRRHGTPKDKFQTQGRVQVRSATWDLPRPQSKLRPTLDDLPQAKSQEPPAN